MVTFVQLCHEIMCYYGIVIKDIKSSPLTFMIVIKASEMVSFSNDFLGGDKYGNENMPKMWQSDSIPLYIL